MKFDWKAIISQIKGKNRVVILLCSISLLSALATWAIILFGISFAQENVFLHYTIYFGVDRTGSPYTLLWIPGVATGAWLIHVGLVTLWKKIEMKILFISLSIVFEVLCMIASLLLVLINRQA